MTHKEFNHLLDSAKALPPDQMRQLRDELDGQLAASAAAARPDFQQPPASQQAPSQEHKPIWEIIEEENRSIPPEVWDALPTDLAEQHDHYIYGTPKRTDA